MTAKFTPATAADYAVWLALHLKQGGRITHFYDYPMNRAGMLTALQPFSLAGECGAEAHSILVPEGVAFLGGDLGHCNLLMSGGSLKGHFVPVYSDEAFHGLPGYSDGMAESRKQDEAFLAGQALHASHKPYSDTSVFVEDGQVCLLPSSMPMRMSPDEALALAENLRAAALGASR